MEKSTGGVSFDISFINSGSDAENYSSVESRRLIGIYNGDWRLGEDGGCKCVYDNRQKSGRCS